MKIYSVSVGNRIRKGITLKKYKKILRLVSYDKKAESSYVSRFYPEVIYTTAVLPPVEDAETVEFLIKSRIGGLLQEGVEYTFLYFPKEKVSETEISYDVYAIPQELYFETAEIVGIPPGNIELFTIDVFSLIPISHRTGNGNVFHFYGDEEKIIITVSEENKPLYSRSIPVPEFIQPEEYTNFYYEHFNLTYMYAFQNKRIDISTVVISGKASSDKDLLKLVKELTGKEPAIPDVKGLVDNMSQEDFMDFILPVGTALLDGSYDFSPLPFKKEKALNKISRGLFLIFTLFSILGILAVYSGFSEFMEKNRQIDELKLKLNRIEKDISGIFSPEEAAFYQTLFSLKSKADATNPLAVFSHIYPVLELIEEKEIVIFKTDREQTVRILAERSFDSISEMVGFKQKLTDSLRKIRGFDISKDIRTDEESFTLKIVLEFRRSTNESKSR